MLQCKEAIATDKADLEMQLLAEYGPHDLESAWRYYKHTGCSSGRSRTRTRTRARTQTGTCQIGTDQA